MTGVAPMQRCRPRRVMVTVIMVTGDMEILGTIQEARMAMPIQT